MSSLIPPSVNRETTNRRENVCVYTVAALNRLSIVNLRCKSVYCLPTLNFPALFKKTRANLVLEYTMV